MSRFIEEDTRLSGGKKNASRHARNGFRAAESARRAEMEFRRPLRDLLHVADLDAADDSLDSQFEDDIHSERSSLLGA